jgi:hypothetical protein
MRVRLNLLKRDLGLKPPFDPSDPASFEEAENDDILALETALSLHEQALHKKQKLGKDGGDSKLLDARFGDDSSLGPDDKSRKKPLGGLKKANQTADRVASVLDVKLPDANGLPLATKNQAAANFLAGIAELNLPSQLGPASACFHAGLDFAFATLPGDYRHRLVWALDLVGPMNSSALPPRGKDKTAAPSPRQVPYEPLCQLNPLLPHAVEACGGLGVSVTVWLQCWEQLRKRYGDKPLLEFLSGVEHLEMAFAQVQDSALQELEEQTATAARLQTTAKLLHEPGASTWGLVERIIQH